MNPKIKKFQSFVANKRIAVLGVGISNRPLIRYLSRFAPDITAFDQLGEKDPVLSRTRQSFESEGININWSTGTDYLSGLKGFDLIFRTPKLRWDLPELRAERERGAIITSEMEVFMELCPAHQYGITGSDGKTTTTTLVANMLQEAGHTVHVGGNIGLPLLDQIEKIRATDKVVLELSSFQLMSMRKSPDTAIITNISPNHLDVHKDYQEYIDAKRNIMMYQPFYGRLVLNAANYQTRSLAPEARGEVIFFSRKPADVTTGFYIDQGWMVYRENDIKTQIVPVSDIRIPGRHNVENYLAAAAAVWPDVKPEHIASVARTFHGVAHRLEMIRELDGVRYYNSSIDTSPTRTKAALAALAERNEKAVLILGGQDKKSDYVGLGEAILSVSRKIIFCGDNSDLIDEALQREAAYAGVDYHSLQIVRCTSYEEAVQTARALSEPGEIVVLSPAGTSYDQFRHFEERGDLFRKLVKELT
ncbi:MAG: UDP-N-acetylmuramoyl-L-alanine--D-glutamate ligase [Clostridiaceae bacterium]|nr:UDP-N-acetylmuramoyl-L-alanine--D-glutamate ligase [Clostridiaceae bacterium]